jgi:hypothetical protein
MPKRISIEPHLSVEEVLFQRFRQILNHPDFVRGLTNFYWWSDMTA